MSWKEHIKENEKFITKVLKDHKAGKLKFQDAINAIYSVCYVVGSDAEMESRHEISTNFGNELLQLSMDLLKEEEPMTPRLFREFLLTKAKEQEKN